MLQYIKLSYVLSYLSKQWKNKYYWLYLNKHNKDDVLVAFVKN